MLTALNMVSTIVVVAIFEVLSWEWMAAILATKVVLTMCAVAYAWRFSESGASAGDKRDGNETNHPDSELIFYY